MTSCVIGGCEHFKCSYVGVNETTLSRGLTIHKASGGGKIHCNHVHDLSLIREDLKKNTQIMRCENGSYRLYITEALII